MDLLQNLNEPQRQAVCHINGPLLVLAGPGSGKTKVITHRIAYLISQGIAGQSILAVTFTNKAADEMAERVKKLVGECGVWVSTFHSFCARTLYQYAQRLGYAPHFSIYDTDNQKHAMREIFLPYKNANIETEHWEIRDLIGKISLYKNQGLLPQDVEKIDDKHAKHHAAIYQRYQNLLKSNNAMDFDDLLLNTLELFTHYSDVLQLYQGKFRYILLDEFQDTNLPQYRIAQKLAQQHSNICATGDPDQSIYSWRGADISNILEFERDFPGTLVVKLEQNYRSTQQILKAASQVIVHNKLRKEKTLWTQNPQGQSLRILQASDVDSEAKLILQDIVLQHDHGVAWRDIAVLYRINSQSRALEMQLRQRQIPYHVVGGYEFYQRTEIKDMLAYLNILANPNDNINFMRIINVPARSIGSKTLGKMVAMGVEQKLPIMVMLQNPANIAALPKRVRYILIKFLDAFEEARKFDGKNLHRLATVLLLATGYSGHVKASDAKKDTDKEGNIQEMLHIIRQYEDEKQDHSLINFLQHIALYAEAQNKEKDGEEKDQMHLMTLHAAKGLEFPLVYILGVNDGILPHAYSQTPAEIEEERRLFFVGITRAQQLLTISFTKYSMQYDGHLNPSYPSPFLAELPVPTYQWLSYCGAKRPDLNAPKPLVLTKTAKKQAAYPDEEEDI